MWAPKYSFPPFFFLFFLVGACVREDIWQMSRSNHGAFRANINYYSILYVRVTKNACDFKLLTTDYRLASCDFLNIWSEARIEESIFCVICHWSENVIFVLFKCPILLQ